MDSILLAWKRAPMLQLACWLALGILAAESLWLVGIPAFIAVLLFAQRNTVAKAMWYSWLTWIACFIVGFTFICFIEHRALDFRSDPRRNGQDTLLVQLSDMCTNGSRSHRVVAQAVRMRQEGVWCACDGRVQCYIPIDTCRDAPVADDVVIVVGKMDSIRNAGGPMGFDAETYWRRQDVVLQMRVRHWEWVDRQQTLWGTLMRFRAKLIDQMRSWSLDHSEWAVLAALLLGESDEMDKSLSATYNATGTIHVLAVSGMHVALVYMVIAFLFRRITPGKRWRWFRIALPMLLLWIYAGITGFSPSVVRSACMCSLFILSEELQWSKNGINSLGASAVIMLAWNPLNIYHIGFQLSFLAVIGMMSIQPLMMAWWRPKHRITQWLWESITTCLAAQLTTLPLLLVLFGQFPTWFLIANLLMVTLSTLALYVGLLALTCLLASPWTAAMLGKVAGWLVGLMNTITGAMSSWPFALVSGISVKPWQGWALALLILGAILYLKYHRTLGVRCIIVAMFIFQIQGWVSWLMKQRQETWTVDWYKTTWQYQRIHGQEWLYQTEGEGNQSEVQSRIQRFNADQHIKVYGASHIR